MRKTSRRRALAVVGASVLTSTAGCASVAKQFSADSSRQSSQSGESADATETQTQTETATETSTPTEAAEETAEQTEEPVERLVPLEEVESPTVDLSGAPLPSTPTSFDYPRMGGADADVVATIYGNWKCPYTREFALNQFPALIREFGVDDIAFEFRTRAYESDEPFLGPDAPRASRAGLAVWEEAPSEFWNYFATVFSNQPPERRAWATSEQLVTFAEAAEVGRLESVRTGFESDTYRDDVAASTAAAADLQLASVPRVVVDGTVTAPTLNLDATRGQLDRALGDD